LSFSNALASAVELQKNQKAGGPFSARLAFSRFSSASSWDYFSYDSVPHEAHPAPSQTHGFQHLRIPQCGGTVATAADDLASTSLPKISPYWRTLIENGSVAIVWCSAT
jgi:hypothetical protein